MLSEFTEIKRLHAMLDEVGIPNDFWTTDAGYEKSYHLCYPEVEKRRDCMQCHSVPFQLWRRG